AAADTGFLAPLSSASQVSPPPCHRADLPAGSSRTRPSAPRDRGSFPTPPPTRAGRPRRRDHGCGEATTATREAGEACWFLRARSGLVLHHQICAGPDVVRG